MKKLVSAIVLVLSAIFFITPQAAHAATYDIIGVGDSIGKQIFPGVAVGQNRWLNGEPSRSPYLAGVPPSLSCNFSGCVNSTLTGGTVQILTWALASDEPGTFVIVQEGAWGDKNGVYIDNAQWTRFIQDVLSVIPDDRTLVFIYPAHDPVVSQAKQDVMYARTIIARDLIWASDQPYVTINWWYAVETHDQNSATPYTKPDGLHPSAAGVAWLQAQINAAIS